MATPGIDLSQLFNMIRLLVFLIVMVNVVQRITKATGA
jgi:hypothetical protein